MLLKEIGEFGFIKKISRGCLIRPQNILKSIGDDAAAFFMNPGDVTLVTTDLLIDRVHFLRHRTTGFNLGYKSLSVNLSDIAAMGGIAREAFVSIAIPADCEIDYLDMVYRGMKTLASEFGVNILGGDTTSSKADLVINITVIGSVSEKEMLCRNGAQHGDTIFLTGFLGDSQAGLHLLSENIPETSEGLKELINAHILPKPFLREGQFLARQRCVHAAIDISDGLGSDLRHIIEQSNVGARIYHEKIPVSKNLAKFCTHFRLDPFNYAFSGGEDYVLLCTVPSDKANRIATDYRKRFNQPLYSIGEITDSGKIELVQANGQIREAEPSGWDHFKIVEKTE